MVCINDSRVYIRSFKAILGDSETQGKACGIEANEACVQILSLLQRICGPQFSYK